MGLLDSVLGQVLNSGAAAPHASGSDPAAIFGSLLQESGGLGGLVQKLQQAGLGDAVGSWIGTGQNQPVSPDQLQGALGQDVIGAVAQKLGLNVQTLLPLLATLLPVLIDRLTPHGRLPDQEPSLGGGAGTGGLGDLLGALGPLLGKR